MKAKPFPNLDAAIDKVCRFIHVDPESVPGKESLELSYSLLPPLLGHLFSNNNKIFEKLLITIEILKDVRSPDWCSRGRSSCPLAKPVVNIELNT